MLLQSKGVVLQSIKYGENSLISKVLSEEKGLISLLSNKTKSKKNKQGNFFQPLSAIQFVCYLSSKSNLHRVKELTYNNEIPLPPESITVNAIRFFLAEFLSKVIREEEQNVNLYLFVERKLGDLNSPSSVIPTFHISFLIELMKILGIQPFMDQKDNYFDMEEGESCAIKPSHHNIYEKKEMELYKKAEKSPGELSKTDRNKLLNMLLNYYSIQLGGLSNIKSKAVLEIVFG
jgi:DNA repair protein RecO (recombination protein O)